MNVETKIGGTYGSITMPNVAYKPSWREKVRRATCHFRKTAHTQIGNAFAAEHVNDLRPLRGALSRVIDIFLASAPSQLSGAGAPLFLKKGESENESTLDQNAVPD